MLRRRAHHSEELRARASRQTALAELGQLALEGTAPEALLDVAAAAIARELGCSAACSRSAAVIRRDPRR